MGTESEYPPYQCPSYRDSRYIHTFNKSSRTAATVEFITCGKFPNATRSVPGGLHIDGIAEKADAHHRQRAMYSVTLRHLFSFSFLFSFQMRQMGLCSM